MDSTPARPAGKRGNWVRRWLRGSLLMPAVFAGCCSVKSWFGGCDTLPHGSLPDPLGIHVKRFQTVQENNAEADDFVIYRNEWLKDGIELGPYGSYHVQQIIRRLPTVPFPVMLQISTDPTKDQIRRQKIVMLLIAGGIADADPRVILGYPEAEGLYGDEAERIFRQMITPRGGGFGGGGFGGAFGGGFGGGGGGFGGLPGIGGGAIAFP